MAQKPRSTQNDNNERRGRAGPVARDAGPAAKAALARAGFSDPALLLHWPEIAGAHVAQVAAPLRLRESTQGGVLTLKTEPAAALFLEHESRALCERINAFLGRPAVQRLRFVQTPIARRTRPVPPRPKPHAIRDDDPALAFRGPDELRKALLGLARVRG